MTFLVTNYVLFTLSPLIHSSLITKFTRKQIEWFSIYQRENEQKNPYLYYYYLKMYIKMTMKQENPCNLPGSRNNSTIIYVIDCLNFCPVYNLWGFMIFLLVDYH